MNDAKTKILVVIESINVDDSSGTKGRVALIQSLAKAGYALTVLHFTQKEIQLNGIACHSVKERKNNIIYLLSRLHRLFNRWFKFDIGKHVDKLFGFSFGFFNDAKSLEKAVNKFSPEQYNMLWTLSKGNSYRTHKAVLALPHWHNKWYAYVHDPFPQQLYPRPYNYVPHGYKQQRYFFRDITKFAKRMVFPSLMLKEWMESYFIDITGKSLIIPHQIPNHEFNNELDLPSYFDTKKFNILHAGNLLNLRDPRPFVEAYSIFLDNYPEAVKSSSLIFLGHSSIYYDYFLKQKNNLPSIFMSKDYVLFEQVYAMQHKASINLILEAKSEVSPFLPGKFPHCVSANKPILVVGPYYSECKRLLGGDYSYCFDFTEIIKIANAIGELYMLWKENKQQLRLNRPDLKMYLSVSNVKKTIEEDKLI